MKQLIECQPDILQIETISIMTTIIRASQASKARGLTSLLNATENSQRVLIHGRDDSEEGISLHLSTPDASGCVGKSQLCDEWVEESSN